MIFDSFDYCDIDPDRTRNVAVFRMIFDSFDNCDIDPQPVRAQRGAYL